MLALSCCHNPPLSAPYVLTPFSASRNFWTFHQSHPLPPDCSFAPSVPPGPHSFIGNSPELSRSTDQHPQPVGHLTQPAPHAWEATCLLDPPIPTQILLLPCLYWSQEDGVSRGLDRFELCTLAPARTGPDHIRRHREEINTNLHTSSRRIRTEVPLLINYDTKHSNS